MNDLGLFIRSRKLEKNFFSFYNSKNLMSFPRNSKNLTFPRTGKIPGKISRATSCQLMFSGYKVDKLVENFNRSKIPKISGI